MYIMWWDLSSFFGLNIQCSYDKYNFIYKFSTFKFNSNLMLWWYQNDGAFKPQAITTALDLFVSLIPYFGGLLFDQFFSRIMVVSPIGINCVLTILICSWLLIVYFWVSLCMYLVHTYIDHSFHTMFLLYLLCSSWLLCSKIYIFMNPVSTHPIIIKPASGWSPWGAPITETDLPIY